MKKIQQKYNHFPVLLAEFLEYFEGINIKVFFDGTLGAAGHAQAILEAHPEIEIFIGCDQDKMALDLAQERLKPWMGKVVLFHGNFSELPDFLDKLNIQHVDGCFLDLGLSSMQLDSEERGFSFKYDAPLDMRMNKQNALTAQDVVNRYSEKDLARIFKEYGEERRWKKVAEAIVQARRKKEIVTTNDLLEVIGKVVKRTKRINPATLIFQALRIEVNNELKHIQDGINFAIERLSPNGRIGVISFHSLEDRIVKHTFRDKKNILDILTKKPIISSFGERRRNPRSRSAKMRFAEKVEIINE